MRTLFTWIVLGGATYALYQRSKNPSWNPLTALCATAADKHLALEKVKVASVPTPSTSVALDPNMSTDQVKQVNQTLTNETEPNKIVAHAQALQQLGHDNSARALHAKAEAVGEAKTAGASDDEVHKKQIEAVATPGATLTGYSRRPGGYHSRTRFHGPQRRFPRREREFEQQEQTEEAASYFPEYMPQPQFQQQQPQVVYVPVPVDAAAAQDQDQAVTDLTGYRGRSMGHGGYGGHGFHGQHHHHHPHHDPFQQDEQSEQPPMPEGLIRSGFEGAAMSPWYPWWQTSEGYDPSYGWGYTPHPWAHHHRGW
jgi:hypothetical protein